MKKLISISIYAIATLFVFMISGVSAFAEGGNVKPDSSLSAMQVFGGLLLLVLAILLPMLKKSPKKELI